MRKLNLSFILLFCIYLLIPKGLISQCTPDPLANKPGVYPADIPHAIAGQLFVQVITVVVPVDTVVTVSGIDIPVTVDSVGLDSIRGLPSGYTFSTNSYNNFWRGGTKGCLKLEGTSNRAGIYNVVIYVRGHTPIILPPYTTIDGFVTYQYQYKMYVDDISSFQVLQNFPNPCYNGKTNITYISASKNIDFRLYDYAGNLLMKTTITGSVGQNTVELDLASLLGRLSNGLYFYSMDDGFDRVTMKMVVDNIQ